MKVLYINTLYAPNYSGGAEVLLKLIVEGVKAKGHDVCVLTTGGEKDLQSDYVGGVKVYRAGIKNLYWHYPMKKRSKLMRIGWHLKDRYNKGMRKYVSDVLEEEKPDIVFCHNLQGWSISVWDEIKAHNIPIVQVLHDLYFLCPNTTMFKNGHTCEVQCNDCSLLRARHCEASAKVTALVGTSNFILKKLTSLNYFKNASRYMIYDAREIDESNVRLPLQKGDVIRFGFIGTLTESKGIAWLIKQFRKLNIESTLTIAGRGKEDYVEYLKEIAGTENIKFIGQTKPEEYYKSIDVSIAPSIWWDTFPGVAYEACAYHVPVIASNRGGLPEIIKDGINGLLCDPADEDSLSRCIFKLSSDLDLYNTLAKNARSSVANLLDAQRWYGEYDSLIKEISANSAKTTI